MKAKYIRLTMLQYHDVHVHTLHAYAESVEGSTSSLVFCKPRRALSARGHAPCLTLCPGLSPHFLSLPERFDEGAFREQYEVPSPARTQAEPPPPGLSLGLIVRK